MDRVSSVSQFSAEDSSAHSLLLRPADLQRYVRDLPASAAILPRLQSVLLDENSDMQEIIELVRIDPGLTTRVMQAAGSVWHHRGGDGVRELDEAIARLGFREAYRIVAVFGLGKFLNTPLKVYGLSAQDFWRRSVAAALIAEKLSAEANLDEGVGYTAGLLHLIGLVFLDRHLRERADPNTQMQETTRYPLFRLERRMMGTDHAQVAGVVLRGWNFSESVVRPIEQQNTAESAPPSSMIAVVARARFLAATLVESLNGHASSSDRETAIPTWLDEISVRLRAMEAAN